MAMIRGPPGPWERAISCRLSISSAIWAGERQLRSKRMTPPTPCSINTRSSCVGVSPAIPIITVWAIWPLSAPIDVLQGIIRFRKKMNGGNCPLYDPSFTGNSHERVEDLSEVESIAGKGDGKGDGRGPPEQRGTEGPP